MCPAFVLSMLLVGAVSASEAPDFRQPVLEFPLPAEYVVNDLVPAADGKTAYVRVGIPEMNVWTPVTWFWPEWTAPLVLGFMLYALVRLRRNLRIPSVVGEAQCRRCGYLLRGLTGDRCPECGTPLTPANRVIGKARGPMVARHFAFVIGLPLLWLIGLSTGRYEGPDCGPYSTSLLQWLDRTGLKTRMYIDYRTRPTTAAAGESWSPAIVEFDLEDGSIVRTVRLDRNHSRGGLAVSDDGASCFVISDDGVEQYRMDDGTCVRRLSIFREHCSRVGMARDGCTVYAQWGGMWVDGVDDDHRDNWWAWDTSGRSVIDPVDIARNRPLFTWSLREWHAHGLPIPCDGVLTDWCAALSPEGRWYFARFAPREAFGLAPSDGRLGQGPGIAVFDVHQGEWRPHIPLAASDELKAVRLTRDAPFLIVAVNVWNVGNRIRVYEVARLAP